MVVWWHLAGVVTGQDLGPDEHERRAQVGRRGLQQLEHVGEDAHAQCEVHRPCAHVQEAAQQHQGPQPVHLTQQHLPTSQPGCFAGLATHSFRL